MVSANNCHKVWSERGVGHLELKWQHQSHRVGVAVNVAELMASLHSLFI